MTEYCVFCGVQMAQDRPENGGNWFHDDGALLYGCYGHPFNPQKPYATSAAEVKNNLSKLLDKPDETY